MDQQQGNPYSFLVVMGIFLLVGALIASSGSTPSGGDPAVYATQVFGVLQATPAGPKSVTNTGTGETIAGLECVGDCIWSTLCVTPLNMTLPEYNGMTRVHSNSCVPINPAYWNIRADPFWGMPCSRETIGTCVWSRNCVRLGRVRPEKNGLTRVYVNSCTAIDPVYQDP